jgi:hypothetical protein
MIEQIANNNPKGVWPTLTPYAQRPPLIVGIIDFEQTSTTPLAKES